MDGSTLKPHEQRLIRDPEPHAHHDNDQDSSFGDNQAIPDLGPLLEFNLRHDAELAALNAPNEVPSAKDLSCPVVTTPKVQTDGHEGLEQATSKGSCAAVTIDGLTFPVAATRKSNNTTTQTDIHQTQTIPSSEGEPTTADDVAMVNEVTCSSHNVALDTGEKVLPQPQQDYNPAQSAIRIPASNHKIVQQAAQPPAQQQLTPVQRSFQTQACTPVKQSVQQQLQYGKAPKQDASQAHMQVPLRQQVTKGQLQARKRAQNKDNVFREHLYTARQVAIAQATPLSAPAASAGRQLADSLMRGLANAATSAIVGSAATGKQGRPNVTPDARGPPMFDGNASMPSAAGSGGNFSSGARARSDSTSSNVPPTPSQTNQVVNVKGQPLRAQEIALLESLADHAGDSAFMEPFKAKMRAKRKASAAALDSDQPGRRARARADSAGSSHTITGAVPGGDPTAIDSGGGTPRNPSRTFSERINERVSPPFTSHGFYNPAELYCIALTTGCALGLAELSTSLVQEFLQKGKILGNPVPCTNGQPDGDMAAVLEQRLRAVSYLIRKELADVVVGRVQSGAIRDDGRDSIQATSRGSADKSAVPASQAAGAPASLGDQANQPPQAVLAKYGVNEPGGNAASRPIQHDPQYGIYKLSHRPENGDPTNKGKAIGPPLERVFNASTTAAASRSVTPQAMAVPSVPTAGPRGSGLRAPSPPPRVPPVNVVGRGTGPQRTHTQIKDGRTWLLIKSEGTWKDAGPAREGEQLPKKRGAQQQLQTQDNAHQMPTSTFSAQVQASRASSATPSNDNAPALAPVQGIGQLPQQAALNPQAAVAEALLQLGTAMQNANNQAAGNPQATNSSLMAIDQLAKMIGAHQQNVSSAGPQGAIPATYNTPLGTSTAIPAPFNPASFAMPIPSNQALGRPRAIGMNAGAEQPLFAPQGVRFPQATAQDWFGEDTNNGNIQHNNATVSVDHTSGNTVHESQASSDNTSVSQMQNTEKPGSSAPNNQTHAAGTQDTGDFTEAEIDAMIQEMSNTNSEDLLPAELLESLDFSQFEGFFEQ